MPPPVRLRGVDAARGLALAGMMAVHVIPGTAGDGGVTLAHQVASGRASALFAVLAGVGLALGSGGPRPVAGPALRAARLGIAARAGVIAVLGLTLGTLQASVAVILAYYGVLFLVAIPVLAWPARRLAVLAAVCAVVTPAVGLMLQQVVPGQAGENVQWADLVRPGYLVGSIVLYGYYPVLTWTTYLFAGLAVGRCDLRRTRTAFLLVVTGAGLAVAGLGTERLARSAAGGTEGLARRLRWPVGHLDADLTTSLFGTPPTDSWWWLLLAGRHSGTPPDLAHTTGTALLCLGVCLLVLPRLGRAAALTLPLVAAGAMTLTLYTVHVLALTGFGPGGGPGEVPGLVVLAVHLLFAGILAVLVGAPERRGPLEGLAAEVARRARELSGRAAPGSPGGGPPSGVTPRG